MPPLQKQVFKLAMGQGIETKTDAKILSSGKMLVLQNAKFTQANRLSKRDGFAAVGSSDGTGAIVKRIDSYNGQVFGWGDPLGGRPRSIFTYNNAAVYASQYGTPTANSGIGSNSFCASFPSYSDCVVASVPIDASLVYSQGQVDSASVNGFTLYAWIGTATANGGTSAPFYKIVDATTNQIIIDDTQLAGSGQAIMRCLAAGNFSATGALLLGYTDTVGNLNILSFDTTNGCAVTSNTFSGMLSGSKLWDWSTHTVAGSPTVFVTYQTAATQLKFLQLSPTGAQVQTSSLTISTTATALGVVRPTPGTASTAYRCIYADATKNMTLVPLNASLTTGTLTTSIDGTNQQATYLITGMELSTGALVVFQNGTSSLAAPMTIGEIAAFSVNTSGTFVVQARQLGLSIASQPMYLEDGNLYFWTLHPSRNEGQYILLHYGTKPSTSGTKWLSVAARTLFGNAMGPSSGAATVAACNITNTNFSTLNNRLICAYDCACVQVGRLYSDVTGINFFGSIGKLTADFNYTNQFHTATLNNQMVIGGGFNALFNGETITELGFFMYPEGYTAALTTTSGSLGIGTYQYACTYEWLDERGNLHRSQTGVPITVTTSTTTSAATLTIPTLRATLKNGAPAANAGIAIYRTTASANPLIYYRVTNGFLQNNTAVHSVTYKDTAADSVITANETIYTQGGTADNYTIDGTPVVCAGPDRLFAADPGNPGVVHVGLQYNPTTGLAFFSGITILLPTTDGPVTNMLFMDSTLVIFKARSIYLVQGVGPTPNGQNNGLSNPTQITADIGCDNVNAATVYPDGIIFKSAKGYYRLGRDFSFAPDTNYIGSGVEAFNSNSCTRAMCRSDLSQCRFVTLSATTGYTTLIYDYIFHQWSQIPTIGPAGIGDLLNVNGNCYAANSSPLSSFMGGALIGQETIGTFVDGAAGIPFLITTGWCALNQLQGCQRVYRVRFLGDLRSTHNLQVEFAYDFEGGDSPTFAETHTITSANITTAGTSAYQCEAFPLRQKCEAIAIRISDPSPTGESFDLTDIEIEVGVIPGRRFPLANTKGF